MGFFENIALALGNLRANKMRSLLTMLGIIIGIAAVIAIETIGSSMTGAVTDSMSGLGVSNITVSLTQKSEEDSSGGFFRRGRGAAAVYGLEPVGQRPSDRHHGGGIHGRFPGYRLGRAENAAGGQRHAG